MKHFAVVSAFLLSALVSADAVTCQSGSASSGDVQGQLTPKVSVLTASDACDFTLRITVSAETKIPQELLSGNELKVFADSAGGANAPLGKGNVTLAAGTVLERSLTLPASAFDQLRAQGEMARAVVRWPGLPGALAEVDLAPDVSNVALEALDLTKTRVVLATNYGQMTLGFRPDKAPRHVENFIKLSKSGFYDGTKFHRVIRGFMIQGGCPNTKEGARGMPGTGNPGYQVRNEFNDLSHTRGILSMARSQDVDSAGSQFFIMHANNPRLDGQYTAFGYLEKGSDTLDRIATVACGGPQGSAPVEPVHLYKAIVIPALKQ